MRISILAATALTFVGTTAIAADWRLGAAGDDRVVFVERSTVRHEQGRTIFWVWIVPKGREGRGDNVKAILSADCSAMKLKFIAAHEFEGERELPIQSPPPGDDDLIPDSLAYHFTSMACGKIPWKPGSYSDPYFAGKWHFRRSMEGSAR